MKATQQLKDDHEVIRIMLYILERICNKIKWDNDLDFEHMDMVLDYIKGFVDNYHHAKEEDILFPAMEQLGISKENGPIAVMLQEHDLGRNHIKALTKAIERVKSGNNKSAVALVLSAQNYIELLRDHIEKENNILFKMADKVLDEKEQLKIFNAFKKLEKEKLGVSVLRKYHNYFEVLKFFYLN